MQFAGHPLPFCGPGEVFDADGIIGQLAMGLFEFVQQPLRLCTRTRLLERIADHEDKSRKDIRQGHVERDGVWGKGRDWFPTIEEVEV